MGSFLLMLALLYNVKEIQRTILELESSFITMFPCGIVLPRSGAKASWRATSNRRLGSLKGSLSRSFFGGNCVCSKSI